MRLISLASASIVCAIVLFSSAMLPAADLGESASIKLIDHTMLDTQRRKLKLVSDVMAGHIVVMNFIYTDCTTVCPVSTSIMRTLNKKILDSPQIRHKVRLVTITLNPTIDTPRKMRQFSRKFAENNKNWLWLTGDSLQVNEALLGLHAYTAELESHANIILVGDPKKNHWTSFYQFPDPENILQRLHEYLDI